SGSVSTFSYATVTTCTAATSCSTGRWCKASAVYGACVRSRRMARNLTTRTRLTVGPKRRSRSGFDVTTSSTIRHHRLAHNCRNDGRDRVMCACGSEVGGIAVKFAAHLPLMDFGGHPYTLDHLVTYTKTAARLGFDALSVNDHMVFSVPWLD